RAPGTPEPGIGALPALQGNSRSLCNWIAEGGNVFQAGVAGGGLVGGWTDSSDQKSASMPSSICEPMTQQMLWQSNLHSTSFFIAVSVLLRTLAPNFALTIANVLSTFERLW